MAASGLECMSSDATRVTTEAFATLLGCLVQPYSPFENTIGLVRYRMKGSVGEIL